MIKVFVLLLMLVAPGGIQSTVEMAKYDTYTECSEGRLALTEYIELVNNGEIESYNIYCLPVDDDYL